MHEIVDTNQRALPITMRRSDLRRVGPGTELAARAIHFQGKRKSGRFVSSTVCRVPGHTPQSELFRLRALCVHRGLCTTASAQDRACRAAGRCSATRSRASPQHSAESAARPREARGGVSSDPIVASRLNMLINCATNMDLAAAVSEVRMSRGLLLPHQRRPDAVPLSAIASRHPAPFGLVPGNSEAGAG